MTPERKAELREGVFVAANGRLVIHAALVETLDALDAAEAERDEWKAKAECGDLNDDPELPDVERVEHLRRVCRNRGAAIVLCQERIGQLEAERDEARAQRDALVRGLRKLSTFPSMWEDLRESDVWVVAYANEADRVADLLSALGSPAGKGE